ncbi:MAG: cation transporter [Burkholderiales bacterium]
MATAVYHIIGMHCKSCVSKTESALRAVPGVDSAHVTLNPPRGTIETSHAVTKEALDEAVRAAGNFRLTDTGPEAMAKAARSKPKESLYPLFLIVGYIAGAVAVFIFTAGHPSRHEAMRLFMAGFFLVFSFFKFLDLRGFAETYRTYDIAARAWPSWGFIYPFAELGLGISYLAEVNPLVTNMTTLVLMLTGSLGVFRALLSKTTIRCACLGTALNLPMTTITLVEDLGMAAMAGVMLLTI